jgi:hypothetical protein
MLYTLHFNNFFIVQLINNVFFSRFFHFLDLEILQSIQTDNAGSVAGSNKPQYPNCLIINKNTITNNNCTPLATASESAPPPPKAASLAAIDNITSTIDSLTIDRDDDSNWPMVGFWGSEWPS